MIINIEETKLTEALQELCYKYNISFGGETQGFGKELAELAFKLANDTRKEI